VDSKKEKTNPRIFIDENQVQETPHYDQAGCPAHHRDPPSWPGPPDPFYLYLWQHHEKISDDHHFYRSCMIYGDLFNPRYQVLVLLELTDRMGERVGESQTNAFVIWEKKGYSNSAIKWEHERSDQTAANCLDSQFFSFALRAALPGFLGGRRDVSTAHQGVYTASLQHADKIFGDVSQDCLQMETVCTDPDF
jgi:hypothetical protein